MLLYVLFARHNITPEQYYRASAGERVLLSAFALHEAEMRQRR